MSREDDLAMRAAEEIMRQVSGVPASVIAAIIRRVVVEPMEKKSWKPAVRVVNTYSGRLGPATAHLEIKFPTGTEQTNMLAWLRDRLGSDIPDACEELC